MQHPCQGNPRTERVRGLACVRLHMPVSLFHPPQDRVEGKGDTAWKTNAFVNLICLGEPSWASSGRRMPADTSVHLRHDIWDALSWARSACVTQPEGSWLVHFFSVGWGPAGTAPDQWCCRVLALARVSGRYGGGASSHRSFSIISQLRVANRSGRGEVLCDRHWWHGGGVWSCRAGAQARSVSKYKIGFLHI